MDSSQQQAIVQSSRTPDRREADELAAAFGILLGREARPVLTRYDGTQPDEWQLRIAGIDGSYELDAVRRFVETAKAMALGGRRLQLVARVDGSIYAVSSRGVHLLAYATGGATLADAQTAANVLDNSFRS